MAFRECVSVALAVFGILTSNVATRESIAQQASPHPVVDELVTKGFAVSVDKPAETYRLTPPLFATTDDASAQKAKLTKLVGARSLANFLRNSPVAPDEKKIGTAGQTTTGDKIRTVDLYFAAHGSLKLIEDKNLLSRIANAEGGNDSPFESYLKTRDGQKLGPGLPPPPVAKDPNAPIIYRYRAPVLEKVVVSGMVETQTLQQPGLLIQSAISPKNLLNDKVEPTVWRAIPRNAKAAADLGPPLPFAGVAGYLQATELKFAEGVVLIETHLVFVEPKGWFNGVNLLGSKLPIVMQNNVRSFRRALAKAQAEIQAK